MSSSVSHLVRQADCTYGGRVRWGTPVPESDRGIYLVATGDNSEAKSPLAEVALDQDAVANLIETRPELTVDGVRPSVDDLTARLTAMWLPDESVVYIGKATNLNQRVGQYYTTPAGARSPHSGGWPLKMLADLDKLWVHWATSPMPELAEQKAMAAFVGGVSPATRGSLIDPDHPYPYANLEGPGGRKRHGIRGARAPSSRGYKRISSAESSASTATGSTNSADQQPGGRTQRVTAADLKGGRIRIPRSSKSLFPGERGDIKISLRGNTLLVRWDPRHGPPERSGTLGIGKAKLVQYVEANQVLKINSAGGVISLD